MEPWRDKREREHPTNPPAMPGPAFSTTVGVRSRIPRTLATLLSKFGHAEAIISLHWEYHVDAYIHGAIPFGSTVTYEYIVT